MRAGAGIERSPGFQSFAGATRTASSPPRMVEGPDTAFAGIAEDDEHLSAIVELGRATDERALA